MNRPRAGGAHRLLGAVTLAVNGLLGLSGALLALAAVRGGAPGEVLARLHALALVLHRGGFGGEPTRLVWALMGVIVPILVVSGYLLAGGVERAAARRPQSTE